MAVGSIYGAEIYSAKLYSWEAAWEVIACAPVTREQAYGVSIVQPAGGGSGLQIRRGAVQQLPLLVDHRVGKTRMLSGGDGIVVDDG